MMNPPQSVQKVIVGSERLSLCGCAVVIIWFTDGVNFHLRDIR